MRSSYIFGAFFFFIVASELARANLGRQNKEQPVIIIGGYTANAFEVSDVKTFCARPDVSDCEDWCERNGHQSQILDFDASFRNTTSDVWCSGRLMEDFESVRAINSTSFENAFPAKHFPWQNFPVSVESGLPLLREALGHSGFSFHAITYDWRRAPGEWGPDLRRAAKIVQALCDGGVNPVTLVSDSYGNIFSHMLLAVHAKELVDARCIRRWDMVSPANGGGGGNYVRQLVAPMQDKWLFGPALYALGFGTRQRANRLYGRMCSKWGAHQQIMLVDPQAKVEDFHSIAVDDHSFGNVSVGLKKIAEVASGIMRENLLATVAQLAAPPTIVVPEVDKVLRGSNFYQFSDVPRPNVTIAVYLARTSPSLENIGTVNLQTPALDYDADNNTMIWGDGEIPYYAQDVVYRLWSPSNEVSFKTYYNQTHGGILTDPRLIRDLTDAILEPKKGRQIADLNTNPIRRWMDEPQSNGNRNEIGRQKPSLHV